VRRVLLPTVAALMALLGPALLGHGSRLHAGLIVLADPVGTAGLGPGDLGSALAPETTPASDVALIAGAPEGSPFSPPIAGSGLFGAGKAPTTGGAGQRRTRSSNAPAGLPPGDGHRVPPSVTTLGTPPSPDVPDPAPVSIFHPPRLA
jgi:hypothetical protein